MKVSSINKEAHAELLDVIPTEPLTNASSVRKLKNKPPPKIDYSKAKTERPEDRFHSKALELCRYLK